MLKGLRDFMFRGNIFELAIAVVMGTAFTAVVTAVVTNLINPVVAAIGGQSTTGLSVTLVEGNPATVMSFDKVITAIINFIVIAVVVYFLFGVPMQRILARRRAAGKGPMADELTDIELLTEIRDLLREQRGTSRL